MNDERIYTDGRFRSYLINDAYCTAWIFHLGFFYLTVAGISAAINSHCVIEGALWVTGENSTNYIWRYTATNPQTSSSHSPSLCILTHLQFPGHRRIMEQHSNGHMLCQKGGGHHDVC